MSSRITPLEPGSSDPVSSNQGPSAERASASGRVSSQVSGEIKPCVVCGKPQAVAFRPFCSRRCADVDLHRWLSGAYALPAMEDDDGDSCPADAGGREGDRRDD